MARAAQPLSITFALPSDALLEDSSSSLEIGSDSSADVLEAVARDAPFPGREILLGSVSLGASGGAQVALGRPGGQVKFGASFQGSSGIAVVDSAEAVVDALGLLPAGHVPLQDALAPDPGRAQRYVLFRAGYTAEGSIEGAHPMGAFGTLSFGAAGEANRLYAIVHRIDPAAGARTAIEETVGSFRLPRQVREARDLAPGSMLIAEVNASIAFDLAASIGYDFSFVRDLGAAGLSGDVGLRIETGLTAALGFSASGRYLVAIDRPSLDAGSTTVRTRLFKLAHKGWEFGLNLSVGVIPEAELPARADDFVKAVFGLHGRQIVRELRRIEEWTDPGQDLSALVAGLATGQGFDLLEKVTGIDPEEAFEQARSRLLEALDAWDALPERAAGAAWRLLDDVRSSEAARAKAVDVLRLLAAGDPDERRKALRTLLGAAGFEDSPMGRFLGGLADRGVLGLLDDTELDEIAVPLLKLVDGSALSDAVRRLQSYVSDALDLERLRTIAAADFDQTHAWLVGRLAAFLDEELDLDRLEEVRALVNKVVTLRQQVYARAVKALNRRYDFTLAAAWQRTTSRSVLLDAEFDLSLESARALFAAVVQEADYDRLLTRVEPGVRLHRGTMSHEIEHRSSVEIHMPFYSSETAKLNRAIASLEAEDDGERVLVYSLDAKDEVLQVNRFRSRLGVTAALSVPQEGVRIHGEPRSSWSYTYLMAQADMRAGEVEEALRPLVDQYFPDHFPDRAASGLNKWVADLDRAVEDATGNGPDEFGDVLISLEVRLPGNVLAPWLERRSRKEAETEAKRVSIRLQQHLKQLIPFYYLQDPDRLEQNEALGALMVWAALPARNDIRVVNDRAVERPDSTKVFWDWRDDRKRAAMILDPETQLNLQRAMQQIRTRLLGAGRRGQAAFFEPTEVNDFIKESRFRDQRLFDSLLFSEARLVSRTRDALLDIAKFWTDARTAPSRSIGTLAAFGTEITKTFNSRLGSVYGSAFLRPLGSMIFLEAGRALDPALATAHPDALLAMKVLREDASYDVGAFFENRPPEAAQVALEQRLVAAGQV